jgi:predicted transcriptional regulator
LIAGAGPLASVGVAAFCYGLARLGEMQAWSVVVTGVFSYLWRINLILIAFNLIPAFPLDGGRLLRAALWGWKGKMQWATRVASNIGRGFGTLMMILGLFNLFVGFPVNGIWYFLIGLFIRMAAQSSYTQLIVKGRLEGITLRRLLKNAPIMVPEDESVESLVENYFYRYQYRLFPAIDTSGRLVGCVKSEVIRKIPQVEWKDKTVRDIMDQCSEDNTIDADTDAYSAMRQMTEKHQKRLIVTSSNDVLGVISLSDILNFVAIRLDLAANGDSEKIQDPFRPHSVAHVGSR